LGASCGVNTILGFFIFYNPNAIFALFGIINIPAWVLGATMVGFDTYALLHNMDTNLAHIGHLAGMAYGSAMYIIWRKRRFR